MGEIALHRIIEKTAEITNRVFSVIFFTNFEPLLVKA